MITCSPTIVLLPSDDRFALGAATKLLGELQPLPEEARRFVAVLQQQGNAGFSELPLSAHQTETVDLDTVLERVLGGGEATRRAAGAGLAVRPGSVVLYYLFSLPDSTDLGRLDSLLQQGGAAARSRAVQCVYHIGLSAVDPPYAKAHQMSARLQLLLHPSPPATPRLDRLFLLGRQTEQGVWMTEADRESGTAAALCTLIAGDLFGIDQTYRSIFALDGSQDPTRVSTFGCARAVDAGRRLNDYCHVRLSAEALERVLLPQPTMVLAGSDQQQGGQARRSLQDTLRTYAQDARTILASKVATSRDQILDRFDASDLLTRPESQWSAALGRVVDNTANQQRQAFEHQSDSAMQDLAKRCTAEVASSLTASFATLPGGLARAQALAEEVYAELERNGSWQRDRPQWMLAASPGSELEPLLGQGPRQWRTLLWGAGLAALLFRAASLLDLPAVLPALARPIVPCLVALAGASPLLVYYLRHRRSLRQAAARLVERCRQQTERYLEQYMDFAAAQFVLRQREELLQLSENLKSLRESWNSLLQHLTTEATALRQNLVQSTWDWVLLSGEGMERWYHQLPAANWPSTQASQLLRALQESPPSCPSGLFALTDATLRQALEEWSSQQLKNGPRPPGLLRSLDVAQARAGWRRLEANAQAWLPLREALPADRPLVYHAFARHADEPLARAARDAGRLVNASGAPDQTSLMVLAHGLDLESALAGVR